MRHKRANNILGKRTGQRVAMLKNLTKSLLIHQRMKTTLARAKAVRIEVEKLITLAKEDTLHHRRLVDSILQDHRLTSELFKEIAPLFKSRNGGYTRIIRLNHRCGDNATMVLLELVERKVKEELPKRVKEKKKAEEKAKPELKAEKKIEPKTEIAKPKKVTEIKKEVKPKAKEIIEPKAKEVKEERPPLKPKGFLASIKKLFKGKEKDK